MKLSRRVYFAILAANLLLAAVVVALLVHNSALARSLQAQSVPNLISYQGMLMDAQGAPLNRAVNLTVALFDVETGGTALWSENYANQPVEMGDFSVLLGSHTPISGGLFAAPNRWLELTVDGETLSPRQKFASVPYAINAQMLGGVDAAGYALAAHTHPGAAGGEVWKQGESWSNVRTGVVDYAGSYNYSNDSMSIGEFYNSFSDSFLPRTANKQIKTIQVFLSRTGSTGAGLSLTFEVRNYNGTLAHTVSAAAIDLKTADPYTWISAPLSTDANNLVIGPGQYLCIHVVQQSTEVGDVTISARFIAEVE